MPQGVRGGEDGVHQRLADSCAPMRGGNPERSQRDDIVPADERSAADHVPDTLPVPDGDERQCGDDVVAANQPLEDPDCVVIRCAERLDMNRSNYLEVGGLEGADQHGAIVPRSLDSGLTT